MKVEDIKCKLSTKQRLDIAKALYNEYMNPSDSYHFICIDLWDITEKLLSEQDHVDILVSEYEKVLWPAIGPNGSTIKRDDTFSEVLIRMILPELLKYRPKVLCSGGGFWEINDIGSRVKALRGIIRELAEKIKHEESIIK